jgi:hypothetical protein
MFWVREALGWVLVALGLITFFIAMSLLLRDGPFLLEGPQFIAIGFFVFRGGLQLIKMSIAGRVSLQAQKVALAHDEAARNAGKAPLRQLPLRRMPRGA